MNTPDPMDQEINSLIQYFRDKDIGQEKAVIIMCALLYAMRTLSNKETRELIKDSIKDIQQ